MNFISEDLIEINPNPDGGAQSAPPLLVIALLNENRLRERFEIFWLFLNMHYSCS